MTSEILMVTYQTTVKMHDTDAARVLFFGHQFKMIHDAYEILLEKIGFSFAKILRNTSFFVPVVHAESDYKAPLFVGDKLTIRVTLEHIGHSSFIVSYIIVNQRKVTVGTARTVHVSVNAKTHKKIPLPSGFRKALTKA